MFGCLIFSLRKIKKSTGKNTYLRIKNLIPLTDIILSEWHYNLRQTTQNLLCIYIIPRRMGSTLIIRNPYQKVEFLNTDHTI